VDYRRQSFRDNALNHGQEAPATSDRGSDSDDAKETHGNQAKRLVEWLEHVSDEQYGN